MFRPILKVRQDLKKWEKAERTRIHKAMSFALQRSSFLLRKDAQQDLKTGRLKLRKLSWYSDRSDPRFKQPRGKRGRGRLRRTRGRPLANLFRAIIYRVDKRKLSAWVGFPQYGGYSWATEIAEKSAEGYTWQYSERYKRFLHTRGIHLKRSTTSARVPKRDIMAAVWDKYERKYLATLDDLVARKLRGEHIKTPEYRRRR